MHAYDCSGYTDGKCLLAKFGTKHLYFPEVNVFAAISKYRIVTITFYGAQVDMNKPRLDPLYEKVILY